MNEAPRRKWLQMHLSTAIVMMIVAGGIIWGNVAGRRVATVGFAYERTEEISISVAEFDVSESDFLQSQKYAYWLGDRKFNYGWPYDAITSSERVVISSIGGIHGQAPRELNWHVGAVVINALIALAILFAVWTASEWWIRRRAARGLERAL